MASPHLLIFLWILTAKCISGRSRSCALRNLGADKSVCVCNATYCDTLERVPSIPRGQFVTITSTRGGDRFKKQTGKFCKNETRSQNQSDEGDSCLPGCKTDHSLIFTIDTEVRYQKIFGFGGAFTDSAGMNIHSLNKELQEHLLRSYFSVEGIEYDLCRVPIGGTDFSTHPYSYDDGPPDPDLHNFSLQKEDLKYKIPLISRAKEMSERDILLVSASWSPPVWMKTNEKVSGFGFLKPEHYKTYADYLIRFLEEYKKHNITFWAISTGNEPSNGVIPIMKFNSLGWTSGELAKWVTHYFGPILRSSPHNETKILALDDQRLWLPWWFDLMVKAENKLLDFIDGIAIHWYWDFIIPVKVVKALHEKYPSKFLLYTEACMGYQPWQKKVDLGSWDRCEDYAKDIMENLNNWVTGWVDWNLALDLEGGPNWVKNYVDSPIIVNASAGEFYKQPMYYGMAHFCKFVDRGSERVGLSPTENSGVQATALITPGGRVVFIVLNKNNSAKKVSINVIKKGCINLELPARSLETVLFETS